jgi:hypothetical protein
MAMLSGLVLIVFVIARMVLGVWNFCNVDGNSSIDLPKFCAGEQLRRSAHHEGDEGRAHTNFEHTT